MPSGESWHLCTGYPGAPGTEYAAPTVLYQAGLNPQTAPLQEVTTQTEEIPEQGGFDVASIDLWDMTVEAAIMTFLVASIVPGMSCS